MSGQPPERSRWIARHLLPHEPALRRFLDRQKLPDGIDADDIVQEVYGRFAEMESVAHIRDARPFMLGVGRNILLQHLRRSRVVPLRSIDGVADLDLPATDPSPEQCTSDRQQLHLLALAIAGLAEPARTVFRLRVIEEWPHRDIGERLGMSENAVQKSYARTLIELAKFLGRGGNGDPRATIATGTATGRGADEARDERSGDERRD